MDRREWRMKTRMKTPQGPGTAVLRSLFLNAGMTEAADEWAALCGAAPDLLNAAECVLPILENLMLHNRTMGKADRRAREVRIEALRVAIAKARGENRA